MKKNLGGRPANFKSPEEMISKWENYKLYCKKLKKPASKIGFMVFCDMAKDTFAEYSLKDLFSETTKKISAECELQQIEFAQMGMIKETITIFNLKNNYGYKDKIETETVNHNLNADISAKDLKEEIRKARSEKENG